MSLFDLRDRAVNRRLLFLVAIGMVLAGLLLGLLDGEPDKRDTETSLSHAKAVHETLSKVSKPALHEATPEEVSEFERRLADYTTRIIEIRWTRGRNTRCQYPCHPEQCRTQTCSCKNHNF